jgi:hypothetical protein
VWIIIVNWNGRDLTLECLRSLRDLTYREHTVLVVDNGSTDGSADAIALHHPEVRLLRLEKNLRFAGGNNQGMRYALDHGAAMMVLLNNDTVVRREFLHSMVMRALEDRRIGMVAPKICYYSSPETIWYAGGIIHPWLGIMRHRGIREKDRGQYGTAEDTGYATGCCVLVTREMVEVTGLLDESYHMYAEDADWSMRARASGFRIVFEPRATILHKVSVSAGGNLSWYKLTNKFLSGFRFFSRHNSWYHWFVFPWMSILMNGALVLRHSVFPEHRT